MITQTKNIAGAPSVSAPTLQQILLGLDGAGETVRIQAQALVNLISVTTGASFKGGVSNTAATPPAATAAAPIFQILAPGTYDNYPDAQGNATVIDGTAVAGFVSWDGTEASLVPVNVDLTGLQKTADLDTAGNAASYNMIQSLLNGGTDLLTDKAWNKDTSANAANVNITNTPGSVYNTVIARNGTNATSGVRIYCHFPSLTAGRKYKISVPCVSTSTMAIMFYLNSDYSTSTPTQIGTIAAGASATFEYEFTADAQSVYLYMSGSTLSAGASLTISGATLIDTINGDKKLIATDNLDEDDSALSVQRFNQLYNANSDIQTNKAWQNDTSTNAANLSIVNSTSPVKCVMSRATAPTSGVHANLLFNAIVTGHSFLFRFDFVSTSTTDIIVATAASVIGATVSIGTIPASSTGTFEAEFTGSASTLYAIISGSGITANASLTITNLVLIDKTVAANGLAKISDLPDTTEIEEELDNIQNQQFTLSPELFFTPLIYLFKTRKYSIFTDNVIRDWTQRLRYIIGLVIYGNASTVVQRLFKSGINVDFATDDINDAFPTIVLAAKQPGNPSQASVYNCSVVKTAINAKSGQTITMHNNGDSITYHGVPEYVCRLAASLGTGITLNTIGTYADQYGRAAECVTGTTFANWIGASTWKSGNLEFDSPYMRVATSTDTTNHPTWCFTKTAGGVLKETSYANATADQKANSTFYIFDFQNYLTVNGFATPNYFSVALGTNDIGMFSHDDAIANMQLYFDIVFPQIKALGAKICVVTATGKSGNYAQMTTQWDLVNAMMAKAMAMGYNDIFFLPAHAFEDKFFSHMDGSSHTSINVSGNPTLLQNDVETVHIDASAYGQYAELLLAWIIGN